jgi:Na+-driven multidrug efflux pump
LPGALGKICLKKSVGLFFHGVWVALGIAGFGIGITYAFAPAIMRAVIHDSDIASQVIDFLLIRIWGLPAALPLRDAQCVSGGN